MSGRLDLPGTYNFREVAPGSLLPGRLYRSDSLHRLTPEGRKALRALGVRTVIDLRSGLDRRLGGADRLRGTGAKVVRIPISGAVPSRSLSNLDLPSIYGHVLTGFQPQIGSAISVVAEADGPVVVHCTAGKDRTGIVVALILKSLGIDEETIVADYVATQANLAGEWTEHMLRRLRILRVRPTEKFLAVLSGSPEQVLRGALEMLDAEHGGVRTYLERAGVGDTQLALLRTRLLPPRPNQVDPAG